MNMVGSEWFDGEILISLKVFILNDFVNFVFICFFFGFIIKCEVFIVDLISDWILGIRGGI